ncbi:MAG: FliM/FliN family flagellar motor switch protein [Hyphomicrobium sp.]|nr:FliM/FliN family flagellar motor switch protein [Hyphomicrobium sp.]
MAREFVAAAPSSVMVLATLADRGASIIVRLDRDAVAWWIAAVLGGPATSGLAEARPLLRIEVNISRILIEGVLRGLASALNELGMNFERSACVALTAPDDYPRQLAGARMRTLSFALVRDVAMPWLELAIAEDLAEKWIEAARRDAESTLVPARPEATKSAWLAELDTGLSAVHLTLDAVLCQSLIDLESVLAWQPGAVVDLGLTTEPSVRLVSRGVPLLVGDLGRVDGRMSVRITGTGEGEDLLIENAVRRECAAVASAEIDR